MKKQNQTNWYQNKDTGNLFRLEKEDKENKGTIIIDIKSLVKHWDIKSIFRLTKKNKVIKDRILWDSRNPLEHEEQSYYKPVRVSNFWSSNYIEYESKGDRNKATSVKK